MSSLSSSPKASPATLELKRSTTELKRAGETLCAMLNGDGGKVLIGVGPDGMSPPVSQGPTFTGVTADHTPVARVVPSRADLGDRRPSVLNLTDRSRRRALPQQPDPRRL